jgi:Ammonium Transporter Family
VGVTSGCAVVEPWAALLIGMVAGWIYIAMDVLLLRWKLDDAVAAIQVHLGSGSWGIVATGLLASPSRMLAAFGTDSHGGWFYGASSDNLLPAQLAGALFIIIWTMLTTVPFFLLLDYLGMFRVNALEELIGLDMSYLEQEGGPIALSSDEPSDDEAVRLAAYRQRFAERKALRTNNKPMSIPHDTSMPEDKTFSAPQLPESYPVPIVCRLMPRATDDEYSRKGSVYSA